MKAEPTELYDRACDIRLTLTGSGLEVEIRNPTDDEWLQYLDSVELLRKPNGRTEERGRERANQVLLASIRAEGGRIAAAEANSIVAMLRAVEIVSHSELEVEITFHIGRFRTAHRFRTPTVDEGRALGGVHRMIPSGRSQRVLTDYRKLGALYDALIQETRGYQGSVPIIHKADVLIVAKSRWKQGKN